MSPHEHLFVGQAASPIEFERFASESTCRWHGARQISDSFSEYSETADHPKAAPDPETGASGYTSTGWRGGPKLPDPSHIHRTQSMPKQSGDWNTGQSRGGKGKDGKGRRGNGKGKGDDLEVVVKGFPSTKPA
ncbi:unnamed protein product [Symbiodinium sp. CCMP2592]|nr:unnamed protein product [Symbiodinium sp. CCMP2592]